MKCLVTGATGFVGGNVARKLLSQGHEVIATGSCPERIPKGASFLPHNLNGIDFRGVEGIDVLFHFAANNNTMEENYEQMVKSNFYAPCDLFLAVLHHSECNQFVYASSTAVYGNQPTPFVENQQPGPLNAYGRSKLRFDDYAIEFGKRHDINMVGLRLCNVYGPGEDHKGPRASYITQMYNNIKKGCPVKLFKDGKQLREWIYVKDIIKASLLAMKFKGQEIFNCGTGLPYTFNDVYLAISKHLQSSVQVEYIDNPCPERYQNHVQTNMNKAKEVLGFVPDFDLENGLKDYLV